jgi:hypothetical protein
MMQRLNVKAGMVSAVCDDDQREQVGEMWFRAPQGSALRVYVSAKHGVDPGLVAFSLLLEPIHDSSVEAQGDGLFPLWHDDTSGLEPGRVEFRRRVRIRPDGATNISVGLRINSTPV